MYGYHAKTGEKTITLSKLTSKLKTGVFDEGKRLTTREWAKKIYGDENKIGLINGLRGTLEKNGFYMISAWIDPNDHDKGKALVPLTSSRAVCKQYNQLQSRRWSTTMKRAGSYFAEEVLHFNDMAGEVQETVKNLVEEQINMQKFFQKTPTEWKKNQE